MTTTGEAQNAALIPPPNSANAPMHPAPSAGDMERAMAIINSSPTPTLPPTPSLVETLPVSGWTVEMKELTGEDEEMIAGYDLQTGSLADLINKIVEAAVVKVTGKDENDVPNLEHLLVGERDWLFLFALRATYGQWRTFTITCPHDGCGEENEVTIDLVGDFPWEHGTDRTVSIELRPNAAGHRKVAVFAHQTVAIQKLVQMRTKGVKNAAKVDTISMGMQLLTVDGERLAMNSEVWAQKLGMGDRRAITRALIHAPGPRIKEVRATCAACKGIIPIGMDWSLLLFA